MQIFTDDSIRFKSKGYSDEELKDSAPKRSMSDEAEDKFWNRVMFPIMDAG